LVEIGKRYPRPLGARGCPTGCLLGRKLFSDPITAQLANLRRWFVPMPPRNSAGGSAAGFLAGMELCCESRAKLPVPELHSPGINIGSLGFLTAVPSDELVSALNKCGMEN